MSQTIEVSPATLSIENDTITFGVPFVKVDVKNRTVDGFATLDNIDNSGEIVDADASREAFAAWPGNIREMHQKVAVGKAVLVTEKQYTDRDGNKYDGIWVRARISKGAQDTWEKVLDGTLTGFSIGGATLEKKMEMSKDSGRSISRVTKYRLTELSVVDNPCNYLSGFSLVKSMDGDFWAEDQIDDLNEDETFNDESLVKFVSVAERKADAKTGVAMENEDFPIPDEGHLKSAIGLLGNYNGDKSTAKAHIISRAKSLGLTHLLPGDWGVGGEKKVEKTEIENDLEKAAPKHKLDDHDADDHLDNAYNEVQNYTDHVRAGNESDRDSHSAHAMDVAGNIASLKRSAQQRGQTYTPASHPMAKGEELQDKENSDISISDEDKGILRKFLSIFKRIDNEVTDIELEKEALNQEEKIEKNDGGDTPEMNEETLREVLGETLGGLTKSMDEKLTESNETLVKVIDEKIATLATSEAVDELKKSLDEVTGRVASLEESGALKKSGDGVTDAGEKLEKRDDGGFWADNIVPAMFKNKGLGG